MTGTTPGCGIEVVPSWGQRFEERVLAAAASVPKPPIEFAVVIPTYRRASGTVELFRKTAAGVNGQIYPHWHVFLMGDKYEPEQEFRDLARLFPPGKCTAVNLPIAIERDRFSGQALWSCGGVNAANIGLDEALKAGHSHTAHLDDDDVWTPEHLQVLAAGYERFPKAVFVYTRGLHSIMGAIPAEVPELGLDNCPPRPCHTLNSATSWHINKIPLRFRSLARLRGTNTPADADMWIRIVAHCKAHGLHTLLMPDMTVGHVEGRG